MACKIQVLVIILFLIPIHLNAQNCIKEQAYTPGVGTDERKEILDAFKIEVVELLNTEVIFSVKYLKVYKGWAWIQVLPESIDKKEHFEDLLALMCALNGNWTVVEIPCVETDNPDCITSVYYYNGLKKRYPELPVCILPISE